MKEIFFMLSLVFQGQQFPTHKEPMPSLEACHEKVVAATKTMVEDVPEMNKDFLFAAGCLVVSKRAEPI